MKILGLLWAVLAAAVSPALAGDTFAMRMSTDIETLDWTTATYAIDAVVLKNIMEGLFELDADMKLQPRLAASHTVSADGRVYTIRIRPGVKWTDGKELTASDFLESWRRLFSPSSVSAYADFLSPIEGAAEFRAGKLTDVSRLGIKALDDHTLEIRLKHPCAYFLQLLGMWVTYPVRADLMARYGPQWFVPEHLVTLGPFKLASYERGKRLVLARNPTYYGPPPALSEVRLEIVNDDATAAALYRDGKLDALSSHEVIEATFTPELKREFHKQVVPRLIYLAFNTGDFPFANPKARKAVAAAIDRSQLSNVLHHTVPIADTFVPRGLLPASSDHREDVPAFDVARARGLWKETGLDALGALKVELVAVGTDEKALLADNVVAQLKRNLGIQVSRQLVPSPRELFERFATHSSSIYLVEWGADYIDAQTFMGLFLSSSGTNPTRWTSARYDELVTKAAALAPGPQRLDLYRDATRMLLSEDSVIIPLHYQSIRYFLKPGIGGYRVTPLGDIYLRDVYRVSAAKK